MPQRAKLPQMESSRGWKIHFFPNELYSQITAKAIEDFCLNRCYFNFFCLFWCWHFKKFQPYIFVTPQSKYISVPFFVVVVFGILMQFMSGKLIIAVVFLYSSRAAAVNLWALGEMQMTEKNPKNNVLIVYVEHFELPCWLPYIYIKYIYTCLHLMIINVRTSWQMPNSDCCAESFLLRLNHQTVSFLTESQCPVDINLQPRNIKKLIFKTFLIVFWYSQCN